MRLFVSVNVPEAVDRALEELRRPLEGRLPSLKWVRAEQRHLTLKFIGEADPETAGRIESTLAEALGPVPPFGVELGGVGVFPSERAPRVAWAGVRRGAEALAALAARVESALAPLGIPAEGRPFQAHLTLGRCKTSARFKGPLGLERFAEKSFGRFDVEDVFLMESRLRPEGALHAVLRDYPLRAPEEKA